MILSSERAQALKLVSEACANGARKGKARKLLNISARTLVRWQKPNGIQDQHHCSVRPPKQTNYRLKRKK